MKLLQVNTTVNSGSTGRIAEDIGKVLLQHGHGSYIAYGRVGRPSTSETIKIGNRFDFYLHALHTRLLDRHGFASGNATKLFIEKVWEVNPDIIHLHNIHGYYIHIGKLFKHLQQADKPVVWTFHDCWPFTGHCSHFDFVNCYKWKTLCHQCPNRKGYPKSWFIDQSEKNYRQKKALFTAYPNLTIITPSNWLHNHVKNSFLGKYPVKTIYNGIDTSVFRPVTGQVVLNTFDLQNKSYILGIANIWSARKGLSDFLQLRQLLPAEIQIVLVGLSTDQAKSLPSGITAFARTESLEQLAALYSGALALVNPTYVDNFPTTNIEALACGTPVVTYNTGGSPEAVDKFTGRVVKKGDIQGLLHAVQELASGNMAETRAQCRLRAEEHFNKDKQYLLYLDIYKKLLERNQ